MKIRWINTSLASEDRGYWKSSEGRFEISPHFRHRTTPDSYEVSDKMMFYRKHHPSYANQTLCDHVKFDTVRACKQWALDRVESELEKEFA